MDAHPITHVADGAFIAVGVGAMVGWFPAVAALLTIIWTAIRIYETKTVQRILGRV